MARVAPQRASCRPKPIPPTEAKSIDRSQAHRSQQIAPTEANCSTEIIGTEKFASHRTKPIAPTEAGRAEGMAEKSTARWGRNSKGTSGETFFFGDGEDDSEG